MTIRSTRRLTVPGIILMVGAGTAVAQEADQQSIPIGEADLYPALRIDYVTNDNIGLRPDDEIDGRAVVIRPELAFVADRRLLEIRAGYTGVYSQGDEPSQDWNDHRLSAGLSAELDSRRRLGASVVLARNHDTLGSELTRGQGDRFEESATYNRVILDGFFSYGATGATGRVDVGARFDTLDYTNLAEVTDGRDRQVVSPYARFGYRISGDTRAELVLRYRALTFDNDNFDRDELSALTGVSFAATGALSGTALIGVQGISRDAQGRDDSTLLVLEAGLEYRPVDYASLTLDIDREVDNNARSLGATGDVESVRNRIRLAWDHDWSSRFSTQAFGGVTIREEACPVVDTTTSEVGVEMDIAVRRWLSFGANAALASRVSSDCRDDPDADELEFDSTTLGVFVRATL